MNVIQKKIRYFNMSYKIFSKRLFLKEPSKFNFHNVDLLVFGPNRLNKKQDTGSTEKINRKNAIRFI